MPDPAATQLAVRSAVRLASLRAELEQAEVDAATLRRDPRGRTWLPAEMHAWVERDPKCAAELAAFVEGERELFAEAELLADPFFTARVLGALPEPLRFVGLSPKLRALVLLGFQALAVLLGYAVFSWASSGVLVDLASGSVDWLELAPEGGAWLSVLAVGMVAAVAFMSSKPHTPAT